MRALRYAAFAALWIISVLALSLFVAAFVLTPANAWTLRDLNRAIDETNFMVNEGCAGTLISVEERHILTAEHCVSRLTKFVEEEEIQPDGTVKKVKRYYRAPLEVAQSVLDDDGNIVGAVTYRAKIVGTKRNVDLALLQVIGDVPATMAAPILPEDGKITRGETVYVIGNPLGLEGTLTKGVVSHLKRELRGASGYENDVKFLQVDPGVAGGNSGGGIFNESGELISVLVRGVRSAGHLGFGVDIDDIRAFLANPKGTTENPHM